MDIGKYEALREETFFDRLGKVVKIVGLTIESIGPEAKLNDICLIKTGGEGGETIYCEVVGFRDNRLILMPFGRADGIGIGSVVENTNSPLMVTVSDELLGHTLDGLGRITDSDTVIYGDKALVEAMPPDPMKRKITLR